MDISPIVEKLLALRGYAPEDLPAYFDPSLKRMAKAEEIPGVPEAVDVILRFVSAKRKIVVFGDYDCDGVCASAIMVTALRKLGGVAEAFIPDRFAHGYGMTEASLRQLFDEHPDVALLVTVDNGICSKPEVAAVKARGVAVVVTDHHIAPPELPEADALVDPKVASSPECAELCGAGLAFFLAHALARAAAERGLHDGVKFGGPLLVMAGLATVADVMPLRGQNRILVKNALKHFNTAPAGLRELYAHASRRTGDPRSRDFGFILSPRINAAGRIANAREAYELLMVPDAPEAREEARRLALRVDQHNVTRKTVENDFADLAFAATGDVPNLDAVVFAVPAESGPDGSDLRTGVSGIVAARLLERYGVPAAIVVGDHGSARAGGAYNVHDALAACADETLVRFGGHAAAGGFTVKPGKLDDFKRLFTAACAAQRGSSASAAGEAPFREPELWLAESDLTLEFVRSLDALEPYGEGNLEPLFGLRGAVPTGARVYGREGQHLELTFAGLPAGARAVWWTHGDEVEFFRASSARVDVSFRVAVSEFGGEPHVELTVVSIRPAVPPTA